ncbi:acetate/propionate family kinase [Mucilaginibacter flavidus]|uniref:acetate/propionate family kinase n=1 Tax=Mucilaginibacter flavidus TaxID=2949309 RepID=UPI00209314EA|nr:acetate/propionate family kinase [Mucilaginibacter flavidus]MCO5948621.1 acetate/propionate family kinase [Mucilaginibacter flavidus]
MNKPAKPEKDCVLTINGGSSSIKFALYQVDSTLNKLLSGELENIDSKKPTLRYKNIEHNSQQKIDIKTDGQTSAVNWLIDWLEKQVDFAAVKGIGHRVVHGMEHTQPERVTDDLLDDLKKISPYDPEHLPEEIKMIEVFRKRYPELVQIACFDTSFHTSMPQVAKLLAIPRRFNAMGIKRYGFHGLSYAYLMEQLDLHEWNETGRGRVILAHLGNGASLAAVKNGVSIDTSMGFSPSSGIPMGTRTGDLDPGVAWYLIKAGELSPKQFNHLVNHESGLLGISETSSDMRELIKYQDTDSRAAEAVELFCYQTKKWIGSFAAALHGVDTLVFSGGIGENSPEVRARICHGLEFLGIELDKEKNLNNEEFISADVSTVSVRVIKTNEELMIATSICHALDYPIKQ